MIETLSPLRAGARGGTGRIEHFDVAVVGAGVSGMTAALLLANDGARVALLDAHTAPGGCAGFFRRGEFSFDVGATTFISFQDGGIGHRLLSRLGLDDPPLKRIDRYVLDLPDRQVPIPWRSGEWAGAWAGAFPELGAEGRRFFDDLARTAADYWRVACGLPSLPLRRFRDVARSLNAVPPSAVPSLRWFFSPFRDFLRRYDLPESPALRGAVNMLLQDTTQAPLEEVPAPYAFLGLTLMSHGLFRPVGGARGLWGYLLDAFRRAGGDFRKKHELTRVDRRSGGWELHFSRGKAPVRCERLVSAIPVWDTHRIAPHLFRGRLDPFLERRERLDSAFGLFLGVRDVFAADAPRHVQVLRRFDECLSDGNNFLVSVSEPGDVGYAPEGFRSVTISTHTDPYEWERLDEAGRREKGHRIVESFLEGAEGVFPGFREAIVPRHFYPASPRTYGRFTRRYMGMAGNQPLALHNANLRAIPNSFGTPNFVQIGDTTFPGAGTVACMLSGFNAYRDCMGHVVSA